MLTVCWQSSEALSKTFSTIAEALNEELLETSYNELKIYQDWGSLLFIT